MAQGDGTIPAKVCNWIHGKQCEAESGETFTKLSPVSGKPLCQAARSGQGDVTRAVLAAKRAQRAWSEYTPVKRGDVLFEIAAAMKAKKEEIAQIVHLETGMSHKAALGEIEGAIAHGLSWLGKGGASTAGPPRVAFPTSTP